ncbi:unnamed protein product [Paramecium sonneborni]|uniref:Uncharacterized protein n=1 Tax=Paramecium sonneborni TaxID=65129 RepID=A0A8S1RSW6_9CILI|nr:unnamed protein product [Paramecium sonneborni]
MILKKFNYQNHLTIIQEKELVQSQIPQIPNYQTRNPQVELFFTSRIYQDENELLPFHLFGQDNTFNHETRYPLSFTTRIQQNNNQERQSHQNNWSQFATQFKYQVAQMQRIIQIIQDLIDNFPKILFEAFMNTKIQIKDPKIQKADIQSFENQKAEYQSFENQKAEYQSFENQKAVYQSFENRSPKIKKDISLINYDLIKQILILRKRKTFTWKQ